MPNFPSKVRTKCAGVPGERTIHCLMKYAVQRQLDNERCEHALSTLLREADVASDWKVDPILHENWFVDSTHHKSC